jgi:hypothetical protein
MMGKTTPASHTSATACCSMAGVTCDSSNKVIKIVWSSKGLSGSTIFSNQLSGSIPGEIGNLRNLQILCLSFNQLSGSIPASIANLINLTTLDLNTNQLSGSIPASIGNLINLQILYLFLNQLSGSIPASIGNLINLQELALSNNQLSGSIPPAIGNLTNLTTLGLFNNPSLNGPFTAKCGLPVYASGTKITICGCVSTVTPAILFPPAGTSRACLSTGSATQLTKRTEVFSQNIGDWKFTCNTDSNNNALGNPYQDCLNAQRAFCDPTYISGNSTLINACKNAVDTMTKRLSSVWQTVRKNCGQWSFDGLIGSVNSQNCINANDALKSAFYILRDGTRQYVDAPFIDSVNTGLWANTALIA